MEPSARTNQSVLAGVRKACSIFSDPRGLTTIYQSGPLGCRTTSLSTLDETNPSCYGGRGCTQGADTSRQVALEPSPPQCWLAVGQSAPPPLDAAGPRVVFSGGVARRGTMMTTLAR